MRIIGGRLRGLKLAEIGAGDPAAHLRPTTDRVRETMFNLLINSLGIGLEGARVLDLDIVLWSGGAWGSPGVTIPHPAFAQRDFVLHPAAAIAPGWRDPITGRTIAQLRSRLTRPRQHPR